MFQDLHKFILESNRIENINGVFARDVEAHKALLKLPKIGTKDLNDFVYAVSGNIIRTEQHMNVEVGGHVPPRGGAHVLQMLEEIVKNIDTTPVEETHQQFLWLHPYMDGNGRCSRAIWLHTMIATGQTDFVLRYGFLRAYYYQTLSQYDRRMESASQ